MNEEVFTYRETDGCTYLEYVLPSQGTDSVTAEMIKYADIPGILRPVVCTDAAQRTVFRFPTEQLIPVETVLRNPPQNLGRSILLGVCDAWISVREYMLDAAALAPGPEGCFYCPGNGKTLCLCLPGAGWNRAESPAEGIRQWCGILSRAQLPLSDRAAAAAVETVCGAGADLRALRRIAAGSRGEQGPAVLIRRADGACIFLRNEKTVVGRATEAPVLCVSENTAVSRNHALLQNCGEFWTVTDASLNHTYHNGKQLPKNKAFPLRNGDILRLATEEFLFIC